MTQETASPRSPILKGARLVLIARKVETAVLLDSLSAVAGIGLRHVEITVDGSTAFADVAAVRKRFPELIVGAGTVRTMQDAQRAAEAGAHFLVSPHSGPTVAAEAVRLNLPYIPGAFTPTEIVNAWEQGAAMVKVFPIETLGTAFLKSLRGPLPDIPVIVTGGLTEENAVACLKAGANAVGLGSQFFRRWQEGGEGQHARLVAALADLKASLSAVYGS